MRLVNLRGHTFVDSLREDSVVLDCGGNHGDFAKQIVERYRCRCVSVEPNPRLAEHIAVLGRNIEVIHGAVAGTAGTMAFHLAENTEASTLDPRGSERSIGTVQVPTHTLDELVDRTDSEMIGLVKMDIEGAEVGAILAASDRILTRISQLTIEFHDFCDLTPIGDIRRVFDRLESAGFSIIRLTRHGHGDVLALHPERLAVSPMEVAWARHVSRNWAGVKRILGRRFRPVTGSCHNTG